MLTRIPYIALAGATVLSLVSLPLGAALVPAPWPAPLPGGLTLGLLLVSAVLYVAVSAAIGVSAVWRSGLRSPEHVAVQAAGAGAIAGSSAGAIALAPALALSSQALLDGVSTEAQLVPALAGAVTLDLTWHLLAIVGAAATSGLVATRAAQWARRQGRTFALQPAARFGLEHWGVVGAILLLMTATKPFELFSGVVRFGTTIHRPDVLGPWQLLAADASISAFTAGYLIVPAIAFWLTIRASRALPGDVALSAAALMPLGVLGALVASGTGIVVLLMQTGNIPPLLGFTIAATTLATASAGLAAFRTPRARRRDGLGWRGGFDAAVWVAVATLPLFAMPLSVNHVLSAGPMAALEAVRIGVPMATELGLAQIAASWTVPAGAAAGWLAGALGWGLFVVAFRWLRSVMLSLIDGLPFREAAMGRPTAARLARLTAA